MSKYNLISKIAIGMFIAAALVCVIFVGGFLFICSFMQEGGQSQSLPVEERLVTLNKAISAQNLNLTFAPVAAKSLVRQSAIVGICHYPTDSQTLTYTEIYVDNLSYQQYKENPQPLVMFQAENGLLALPESTDVTRYYYIKSDKPGVFQVPWSRTEVSFGNRVPRTPENKDARYVIALPSAVIYGDGTTEDLHDKALSEYESVLTEIATYMDLTTLTPKE